MEAMPSGHGSMFSFFFPLSFSPLFNPFPRYNKEYLTTGGWWHVDQNSYKRPHKQGKVCVQGLINYYDSNEETGVPLFFLPFLAPFLPLIPFIRACVSSPNPILNTMSSAPESEPLGWISLLSPWVTLSSLIQRWRKYMSLPKREIWFSGIAAPCTAIPLPPFPPNSPKGRREKEREIKT